MLISTGGSVNTTLDNNTFEFDTLDNNTIEFNGFPIFSILASCKFDSDSDSESDSSNKIAKSIPFSEAFDLKFETVLCIISSTIFVMYSGVLFTCSEKGSMCNFSIIGSGSGCSITASIIIGSGSGCSITTSIIDSGSGCSTLC